MPETTPVTSAFVPELPALTAQAERLIELGVHEIAGLPADQIRSFAKTAEAPADASYGTHRRRPRTSATGGPRAGVWPARSSPCTRRRPPASALAPLLRREGKPGFVVTDMPDVDEFTPLDSVTLPEGPLYLVAGIDRGDHMANWSPDEALPALTKESRTPLVLTEGIHWVLQQPEALERNHCFMTIGSRLRKANGTLDSRTPAIWISNGTGRDGRERRNAPKVGWCWAGNRHTWLGFASATGRSAGQLVPVAKTTATAPGTPARRTRRGPAAQGRAGPAAGTRGTRSVPRSAARRADRDARTAPRRRRSRDGTRGRSCDGTTTCGQCARAAHHDATSCSRTSQSTRSITRPL
ncbi:hypothetical protein GCM10009601_35670 [Streptomyces thermospinosisporus]|uniref:Uncharacterized protein n=1 Tax=Streptomyces thermospinosisporus TaxID=161482 RepID=A0ABP4JRQ4_9ACTN